MIRMRNEVSSLRLRIGLYVLTLLFDRESVETTWSPAAVVDSAERARLVPLLLLLHPFL